MVSSGGFVCLFVFCKWKQFLNEALKIPSEHLNCGSIISLFKEFELSTLLSLFAFTFILVCVILQII